MRNRKLAVLSALVLTAGLLLSSGLPEKLKQEEFLAAFHSISSHKLLSYVEELCSEKYAGRLTGTEGFNMAARWVISLLQKWGLKPAGDDGSYLQAFPNPYTLVLPGAKLCLRLPVGKGAFVDKCYRLEEDFIPGATSASGEVEAEVVYVGYGITAPELGYDDYAGVDVKGKIVLMEREVPVSPSKDPELFKRWRPYSFHQYKVHNAKAHGAAGMLYIYHIANPNCDYIEGLLLSYVGKEVVEDLFKGLPYTHKEVVERIKKTLKPFSFSTGKKVFMKNVTEHHPEGIAYSVLALIEGNDPKLRKEVIVLSAHLDHVGKNPMIMPGANDNASGVAVLLGVAEALSKLRDHLKRSVLFAFFGAEEQGVKGSEYFLKHPPLKGYKITACINLDGVGRGDKLIALAAKNYPQLWSHIEWANRAYIHRIIRPVYFANITRPRLDAARFMWAGIPTVSFFATGGKPLPFPTYHRSTDRPEYLTPEIMEDLAQLLTTAVLSLAN